MPTCCCGLGRGDGCDGGDSPAGRGGEVNSAGNSRCALPKMPDALLHDVRDSHGFPRAEFGGDGVRWRPSSSRASSDILIYMQTAPKISRLGVAEDTEIGSVADRSDAIIFLCKVLLQLLMCTWDECAIWAEPEQQQSAR